MAAKASKRKEPMKSPAPGFNDLLQRMLSTPPKPHPKASKKKTG